MSTILENESAVTDDAMHKPATRPNVGPGERIASTIAGAALTLLGVISPRTRAPFLASGGMLLYRGLSGNCLVYRALGVDYGVSHDHAVIRNRRGVHFDRSIVIARPADVIYGYWRSFKALPQLIDHMCDVSVTDSTHTHWIAKGPLDVKFQWDAEITEERPNEFLAWRSLPEGDLATAGSLRLQTLPHDRGTAVRVVMSYDPPGGALAARLARWLGTDVESEIFEGLRRMKQILEAGEVPTISNQPTGHCAHFGGEERES